MVVNLDCVGGASGLRPSGTSRWNDECGQSQEPASAWHEGAAIIRHGADDSYG